MTFIEMDYLMDELVKFLNVSKNHGYSFIRQTCDLLWIFHEVYLKKKLRETENESHVRGIRLFWEMSVDFLNSEFVLESWFWTIRIFSW